MVPGQTERYQLLVADDDAGFRAALREVLLPHVDLIEADSGEQALEIVEFRPVHIALLDMHMRVLTGLETLRAFKTINSVAPCILMTAHPTQELCQDAERAQVYTVLKKPIPRRILLTTVSSALRDAYHDPHAFWLNN